jgi:hypothetical protein
LAWLGYDRAMLAETQSLPEDPAELRDTAQQLVSLVKSQALRIAKLEHQLAGMRRHRFGTVTDIEHFFSSSLSTGTANRSPKDMALTGRRLIAGELSLDHADLPRRPSSVRRLAFRLRPEKNFCLPASRTCMRQG